VALLPVKCLCGNEGVVSELQTNPRTWDVLCFDDGCSAKTPALESEEAAIRAWNRMQEDK
jgi:hypothetical protein